MNNTASNAEPAQHVVLPVADLSGFIESLRLRYRVYRELGYIDHDDGLDLDEFDRSSLHFNAVGPGGGIAGTVRLILPVGHDCSIGRDGLAQVGLWCDAVQRSITRPVVGRTTLPVFETMRDNQIPLEARDQCHAGELSRIIVAPSSRGMGLASRLAAAVVDSARDLGLRIVFIECLPPHVPMFARFGFEIVNRSLDYSLLLVPNRVVAMKLSIA